MPPCPPPHHSQALNNGPHPGAMVGCSGKASFHFEQIAFFRIEMNLFRNALTRCTRLFQSFPLFSIPDIPHCSRVFVGSAGMTFQKLNTRFEFTQFGDSLMSVCRTLCLYSSRIQSTGSHHSSDEITGGEECLGFTFHKLSRTCRLAMTTRSGHIRTYSHQDYLRAAYLKYRQGTSPQCPIT